MIFKLLSRIGLLRAVETFLVRWADYSIVGRFFSGRAGVPPVATLTLTTIGRRSGRRIATPLFYFRSGEDFLVVGSRGGAPRHPAWVLNVQAHPQAWLRLGRREMAVQAEVVEGPERAALWDRVAASFPPYERYQERAWPREIPVVRLRLMG